MVPFGNVKDGITRKRQSEPPSEWETSTEPSVVAFLPATIMVHALEMFIGITIPRNKNKIVVFINYILRDGYWLNEEVKKVKKVKNRK